MYNEVEIPLHASVQLMSIENKKLKTDVVLKKDVSSMWNCLNGEPESIKVNDNIYINDEENPKKTESMMELLRDIYSKGDEDIKKAMNKSLRESSGTVLNTNWKDVCSKEVKPEN
jgi:hypothetical protein